MCTGYIMYMYRTAARMYYIHIYAHAPYVTWSSSFSRQDCMPLPDFLTEASEGMFSTPQLERRMTQKILAAGDTGSNTSGPAADDSGGAKSRDVNCKSFGSLESEDSSGASSETPSDKETRYN